MAPTFGLRVWPLAALLALLLIVLASAHPVSASDSCDATVFGGNSIQAAIDRAEAGDTVCLEAGHFTGTLVIDKELTLAGAGPGTIVQAAASAGTENAGRVLLVTGDGIDVTIHGVVIRYGVKEVGAGVAIEGAYVRIEDSTITDNQSPAWGGGIGFLGGGTLDLVRSTVSNNTSETDGAGVDVYDSDEVRVIDSTIAGNRSGNHNGGGIWIGDDGTTLLVDGSTISGNSGGGIRWSVFEDTPGLVVVNSTISGNTDGAGLNHTGGPDDIGSLTVLNSTIARNAEPVEWLAHARVANTIVTDGCSTALAASGGHNLEAASDTCGFRAWGDAAGVEANADLEPLGGNGGPTLTHAPGTLSDAVGAGDPVVCAGATVGGEDQRGRPRDGDACTIGASEVECTFNPGAEAAAAGVSIGTASGCRLADLASVTSVWVTVDGALVGYIPGAPAWANAAIEAAFPGHAIPPGTAVIFVEW